MKQIRFGIIGEYQSGKSLLINCLLRRSIAKVGNGNATTHTVVNYLFSEDELLKYVSDDGKSQTDSIEKLHCLETRTDISVIDVYLNNDLLKDFVLTDMPGFGANTDDNSVAKQVMSEIDFALLMASNEKSFGAESDSFNEIRKLQECNIPYYFILNCTNRDRWRCDDDENVIIAKKDLSLLSFHKPMIYPLKDDSINIVNLMWYWYSICKRDDELISRYENTKAFNDYGINNHVKEELNEASNFTLIKNIFEMESRAFLELKRDIKIEIAKLREELCPIGTIQAFAFDSIPYGWLPCDGSKIDINEYHELFKVIGNTFGENEKNDDLPESVKDNTFCLPNLQDKFVRGWGGNEKKREFGSTQKDAFQGHSHIVDNAEGETGYDGSHTHKVYREEHGGGMGTCFYSLNHEDNCVSDSCKKGSTYILSGGLHKHKVELEVNVKDPYNDEDSTYGIVRCENETRPINIALLYCIKAI